MLLWPFRVHSKYKIKQRLENKRFTTKRTATTFAASFLSIVTRSYSVNCHQEEPVLMRTLTGGNRNTPQVLGSASVKGNSSNDNAFQYTY